MEGSKIGNVGWICGVGDARGAKVRGKRRAYLYCGVIESRDCRNGARAVRCWARRRTAVSWILQERSRVETGFKNTGGGDRGIAR